MVCRTAQVGSAVTSYALQTSSLEEQQVLSLYHEVMREGRTAATPTSAQQNGVIHDLRNRVIQDTRLTPARARSIMARLERARSEDMDGRRWYATDRLLDRVATAERALNAHVTDTARRLGVSEEDVRTQISTLRTEAQRDRSLRPSPGWVAGARERALGQLPLDRQTAYALEHLEQQVATHRSTSARRPSVTRSRVEGDPLVTEMGYDQATGRCEVMVASGVVRVYQMTPAEYEDFRLASNRGDYYTHHVAGNPDYQYTDSGDADAAAEQAQCGTCGQFAGPGHTCPTRNSREEVSRTARRARRAVTQPAAPPADEPTRLGLGGTSARRYSGDSGRFATPNLTDVRRHARQSGQVTVEVDARIRAISQGEDAVPVSLGAVQSVEGAVDVTYRRGQGYTVTPVTSPGDTGNDRLRCRCDDYRRAYDCVHVRQTVQDIQTRLNQDSLRRPHGIGPAIEQVNAELAEDLAASQTAQQAAQDNYVASPVSYTEDHAAFQRDYRAARDRVAAGEDPVPYMTENATGGLGARGTGRAFGIELEFDVSNDAPGGRAAALDRIGRAMHAAGLTSSARMSGYHASQARGYTENHQGGWSFEYDCTVAGEIVSPIMYDEPQTWENIAKVCQIITENGGTVTQRTGCHVHVSAHNYDHTVANHNRLLGMFAENEDLIYRLSSDPTRGRHRGRQWCAPNRVPATGYANVSQARYGNVGHGLGLNLQSVSGRSSDHVEFRTWDGTLTPSVIQTQIKMSLGMTEAAFRDTTYQPSGHNPVGSHRAHNRQTFGESRRLTGEAWRQDVAGYKAFADRLFTRPEDKAQMTALFAVTRWQRSGR